MLKQLHLALITFLLSVGMVRAQDPSSVDIDLRQSIVDTNNLEVYVRANGAFFEEVLSGLTFTIRWVTTSPATLGTRVNSCPAGIGVSPTAQVTNPVVNGNPIGFNYRSFNAFGTSLLSDEGCPLPQDTWLLVTTIPVENNPGCTEFQIVNDEFTSSPGNARDYFVSLGGVEKTGVIEPTAVNMGACVPDCLGVPGGTALPGTPCDDGNPDTMGETFTADCVCSVISTAMPDVWSDILSVSQNPTAGPVWLHVHTASTGALVWRLFNSMGVLIRLEGAPSLPREGLFLDLADLPSGAYLLDLEMGGRHATTRIVRR